MLSFILQMNTFIANDINAIPTCNSFKYIIIDNLLLIVQLLIINCDIRIDNKVNFSEEINDNVFIIMLKSISIIY